jgi:hypothetical protein
MARKVTLARNLPAVSNPPKANPPSGLTASPPVSCHRPRAMVAEDDEQYLTFGVTWV